MVIRPSPPRFVQFEMKPAQEVMERRRQEHGHHRQEEHSTEKRVRDREDFRRRAHDGVDRSHAGQNHRRVERGVQPRQPVKEVVAHGPDTERGEDQAADDGGVAGEPPGQEPALGEVRGMRHDITISRTENPEPEHEPRTEKTEA